MIGIFDSGEGGLSVLREIIKAMPDERYIYYSDNANCPYGDKGAEFVISRAEAITKELVGQGADIIVVACNTATSAAIAHLREHWSDAGNPETRRMVKELTDGRHDHIMFIGMEPAVKPAALDTKSGVVGVLATAGTLKGRKYLSNKENVNESIKVVENVGRGFVELVEAGDLHGDNADRVVQASLQPLLDAGADVIVLGCTHYPFLLDTMKKIAGPDVKFIDPAPAVTRQLIKVMQQEGLACGGLRHPASRQAAFHTATGHDSTIQNACIMTGDSAAAVTSERPGLPEVRLISSGSPDSLMRTYQLILNDIKSAAQ